MIDRLTYPSPRKTITVALLGAVGIGLGCTKSAPEPPAMQPSGGAIAAMVAAMANDARSKTGVGAGSDTGGGAGGEGVADLQSPTGEAVELGASEGLLRGDEASESVEAEGEVWQDGSESVSECDDYRTAKWAQPYTDPYGKRRKFGYDGYLYRNIAIERTIGGVVRKHCVRVYFPPGGVTAEGKRVRIIDYITPAWYRLIANTLQRLPWLHLQVVKAMVLDDRPMLHGIASYSRRNAPKDARDGHTIWLNKRLFMEPNGLIAGNYGMYWAYRINEDGIAAKELGPEHDYFSPVLIHEIGHLVMYHRVNGSAWNATCPACSKMCGDERNCDKLTQVQKEKYCVTPYCTGFGFSSGTENFAEMYRWYYQSEQTRGWLLEYYGECYQVLKGMNGGLREPWKRGLGQVQGYRQSQWDSCKGGVQRKDWAGRCEG